MESPESAIDTGQVILSWPKMEVEFCRIEAIGLVYVDFEIVRGDFLLIFAFFAHFLLDLLLVLLLGLLLVFFLAFLSHLDFSFFTLFQKVVLGNFAETGKG